MDQFMNREAGIQALKDASQQLERASRFLHERADDREDLVGATSEIIGGICQAVSGLADQIEDGVLAQPSV